MTAEKPTNVIDALARVIAEMPGIGKDAKASDQQGGYKYRGIEAVTREVQGLLGKHGVVFVPEVLTWDTIDLTVNNKPWTDTKLRVQYRVYGPGGIEDSIVVGPICAIGRDNSDKGANKAMTQAFKYALLQTLCISDAKDDGDQASHEADEHRPIDASPLDKAEVDAMTNREVAAAVRARGLQMGGTPEQLRQRLLESLTKTAEQGEPSDSPGAAESQASPPGNEDAATPPAPVAEALEFARAAVSK